MNCSWPLKRKTPRKQRRWRARRPQPARRAILFIADSNHRIAMGDGWLRPVHPEQAMQDRRSLIWKEHRLGGWNPTLVRDIKNCQENKGLRAHVPLPSTIRFCSLPTSQKHRPHIERRTPRHQTAPSLAAAASASYSGSMTNQKTKLLPRGCPEPAPSRLTQFEICRERPEVPAHSAAWVGARRGW